MTTTLDYALMAGAAYYSTRAEVNRFPIPNEWSEVVAERVADTQTGFEARTFQKGTEIVISFSGTDPNNSSLLTSPDGRTNASLANGTWSDQLLQAAKYYLDVKIANPNATITFTGHSLGGGACRVDGGVLRRLCADDTLFGGAGNDRLIGGVGKDNLNGGEGDDLLFGDTDSTNVAGNVAWITLATTS